MCGFICIKSHSWDREMSLHAVDRHSLMSILLLQKYLMTQQNSSLDMHLGLTSPCAFLTVLCTAYLLQSLLGFFDAGMILNLTLSWPLLFLSLKVEKNVLFYICQNPL